MHNVLYKFDNIQWDGLSKRKASRDVQVQFLQQSGPADGAVVKMQEAKNITAGFSLHVIQTLSHLVTSNADVLCRHTVFVAVRITRHSIVPSQLNPIQSTLTLPLRSILILLFLFRMPYRLSSCSVVYNTYCYPFPTHLQIRIHSFIKIYFNTGVLISP